MSEENDYLLTTVDNKFDPFTQYSEWYAEDCDRLGYNTPALMARLGAFSNDMPEDEYEREYDDVCERLLNMFPSLYKKVYRNKK